jgi:ATP-dependent Clp protease protease subunit
MLKSLSATEEKLLQKRVVLLYDSINPNSVEELSQKFLYLATNSAEPITFFINSSGGRVIDTLALHDLIINLPLEVRTVGLGVVASMAVLLLASGKRGQRYLFPNTTIHIHLPFGRTEIEGTKIEETADEVLRISQKTGRLLEKYSENKLILAKLPKEGLVIDSEAAISKYGLADHIISGKTLSSLLK